MLFAGVVVWGVLTGSPTMRSDRQRDLPIVQSTPAPQHEIEADLAGTIVGTPVNDELALPGQ